MRSEQELYEALLEVRRKLNNVIETFELFRAGIMTGDALSDAWTDFNIAAGKINAEMYGYAYWKGQTFEEGRS